MIDFSKCPCIYWSNITKISYLQRRVIVYSIMYYEYNESCVPDAVYDGIVKQLLKLQNEATEEELRKTTYYYVMYDFDGSTGFHLPGRLTRYDRRYLTHIAHVVHKMWRKEVDQQNEKGSFVND